MALFMVSSWRSVIAQVSRSATAPAAMAAETEVPLRRVKDRAEVGRKLDDDRSEAGTELDDDRSEAGRGRGDDSAGPWTSTPGAVRSGFT